MRFASAQRWLIFVLGSYSLVSPLQGSTSYSFDANRLKDGRIILESKAPESTQSPKSPKSDDCTDLRHQLEAIARWKEKVDHTKANTLPRARIETRDNGSRCVAEIQDILPQFLRRHYGETTRHDGPNCWNLALVMSELIPAFRYASEEEMSFWMASPLCRALKPDESLEPGDIVAVRRGGNGDKFNELHAHIYVSDQLVFAKYGAANIFPFSFANSEEILSTFRVPENPLCRRAGLSPPARCPRYAVNFRCQSFADYLSRQSLNSIAGARFKQLSSELLEVEHCVSRWTQTPSSQIGPTATQTMLLTIAALENLIRKESVGVRDETVLLLWRSLLLRLGSIRTQIEFL